jgi:hypothetical protein
VLVFREYWLPFSGELADAAGKIVISVTRTGRPCQSPQQTVPLIIDHNPSHNSR